MEVGVALFLVMTIGAFSRWYERREHRREMDELKRQVAELSAQLEATRQAAEKRAVP